MRWIYLNAAMAAVLVTMSAVRSGRASTRHYASLPGLDLGSGQGPL